MAEEFEESEVIFPDHEEYNINDYYFIGEENSGNGKANKRTSNSKKKNEEYNINDYYFIGEENSGNGKANKRTSNSKKKNKSTKGWETTGSLPVDIPSNVLRLSHEYQDWLQEEYDGGELVPPHKIVGGRIAGKMAFSVCTGSGRTLKGRDLSEVRNSILRLTGFLET